MRPTLLCLCLLGCGDTDIASGGAPGGDAAGNPDAGMVTCAPEMPSMLMEQPAAPAFVFQVIGDVHAHADAGSNVNIPRALADLRAIGPDARALVINGDLTEHGYASEYSGLATALSGGSAWRLFNLGNHEYHGTDPSDVEKQRYLAFTQLPNVYYAQTIAGYPFLFLAGENGDFDLPNLAWTAVLSDAQLDWLGRELLQVASPSRPSFVFLHQPPWDSSNPNRLDQILSSHPNVVFFWSHYHRDLHSRPIDGSLINRSRGYQLIHTSAVQYIWDNNNPNGRHDNWYQGLQVWVYPDRVQVRGRDFATQSWVPEYEYQMDYRAPTMLGAAAANIDGSVEIVVAAPDGTPSFHRGADWSSTGGATAASAPAIGRNADGRLEAFVRAGDGALWHSAQESPGGIWSAWSSLGGALTSSVAVATNADGRLQIFARGTDDALWTRAQQMPGDANWTDWVSLGGILTPDVAVAQNSDGRLEVFSRGIDSSLAHIWQSTPGGSWSGWGGLGGVLISGVSVARNADGRLEVFARGLDAAAYHIWQVAGGWSDWTRLGGAFAGTPVAFANPDGRLELFARGTDGAMHHSTQLVPGGAWSDWSSLAGMLDSDPIVAVGGDGRVTLFARGTDGALWSNAQQMPGACWADWSSLGKMVTAF